MRRWDAYARRRLAHAVRHGLPAEESRAIAGALSGTLAQFDRVFSPLLPVTERLPLPATRRFRAAHETFDRLVYG